MKSLHPAVLLLLVPLALVPSGCEEQRDPLFSTPKSKEGDPDVQALQKDLQELRQVRVYEETKNTKGKEDAADQAIASYHEAMQRLTRRGAAIETQLIETLLGSDDWGVRLGVVETMQAVGGKPCISPLIQVLTDPQPLVAMNANLLLEEMTKHKVIPESGKPAVDGLAPVPAANPQELDPSVAFKAWSAWHAENKLSLQKAWSSWWEQNKATAKID